MRKRTYAEGWSSRVQTHDRHCLDRADAVVFLVARVLLRLSCQNDSLIYLNITILNDYPWFLNQAAHIFHFWFLPSWSSYWITFTPFLTHDELTSRSFPQKDLILYIFLPHPISYQSSFSSLFLGFTWTWISLSLEESGT